MSSLILCRNKKAEQPYHVKELSLNLYTGEELSYYIYHYLMLVGDDFLDERLFRFIGQELGMTELETKLRRWSAQASQAELLLVILQDIHYYSNDELLLFRNELNRIAKAGPAEAMKEKADFLMKLHQYYGAIRLYDRIFSLKSDELMSEAFRGRVWFNKGSALAGIFSFDQAVDCYEKSYELLHSDEALRKIYEIHLLDGLARYPVELMDGIPQVTLSEWKEAFEQLQDQSREEGRAQEAAAWKDRDSLRRAAGYSELARAWKAEYRRSQGE